MTERLKANRAGGSHFCRPELVPGTHDPEKTGGKDTSEILFGLR
jgi:hypothetical protein